VAYPPAAFSIHFTPTSASWINQIERGFAQLARKTDIRAFIGSAQPRSQALQ
jgi:hypothetical protein